MSLIVRVEIAPSTRIDTAANELVALSRHLQQRITAEFNGVTLVAMPGDTPDHVIELWDQAIKARAEAEARERERRKQPIILRNGMLVQTPAGLMRIVNDSNPDWIQLESVERGDDRA